MGNGHHSRKNFITLICTSQTFRESMLAWRKYFTVHSPPVHCSCGKEQLSLVLRHRQQTRPSSMHLSTMPQYLWHKLSHRLHCTLYPSTVCHDYHLPQRYKEIYSLLVTTGNTALPGLDSKLRQAATHVYSVHNTQYTHTRSCFNLQVFEQQNISVWAWASPVT